MTRLKEWMDKRKRDREIKEMKDRAELLERAAKAEKELKDLKEQDKAMKKIEQAKDYKRKLKQKKSFGNKFVKGMDSLRDGIDQIQKVNEGMFGKQNSDDIFDMGFEKKKKGKKKNEFDLF